MRQEDETVGHEHGLRLMFYDDTCRGTRWGPGLTHSWIAGALLYRGLGRLDAVQPVRTWPQALEWLATTHPDQPIAEIQYWGHGKWGQVLIDGQILDEHALAPDAHHATLLDRIRERLTGPEALWWFRTCETFGCAPGQRFARRWVERFGCRAAGHTFIIGPWQSGLHTLDPGRSPTWSPTEGLAEGTPEAPKEALWSARHQPHTISCLHGAIPQSY